MKEQQAYGFIHCHSVHSLKDSALKIPNLVNQAVEMGAKAVTLTDHGTCTGLFEFIRECKANNINGIPGVEAYVEGKYDERCHLILLAKNYAGYQEICRAVTMSNGNLKTSRGGSFPIMNKEILQKCFGNGNVIATSACVSGVLASILLADKHFDIEKEKLIKRQKRYADFGQDNYEDELAKRDELDKQIHDMIVKRDIMNTFATKKYTMREKGLKTLVDNPQLYQETKEMLEREMAETQKAIEELPELKKELTNLKRARTVANNKCKKLETIYERHLRYQRDIDAVAAKCIGEAQALKETEEELLWYKDLFKDNFYVELQYHGLEDEKYVMSILVELARKHNVPLVATNDVHIATKEEAEARQIMRSLRYKTFEERSDSDDELYMKSDKELSEWLLKVYPQDAVEEAINNIQVICDQCHVEIPTTTHYPKYRDDNGEVVEDAASLLRGMCQKGIEEKFNGNFDQVYQDRLEYELGIIISLGFDHYLLIVQDYINYARNLSKELGEGIGYGIGPGRGSGAGSIVNYLLGITAIDPIPYGLKFERFLNKDRVSMPDIDADFSDEVRGKAIDYVSDKYGQDCTAGIRTNVTQGAKGALRNVGRVLDYEIDYHNGVSKNDKARQSKDNTRLANLLANEFDGTIEEGEEIALRKYNDPKAKEIIRKAKLVEGTTTGIGVHAAGIIISDGLPLSNYVPVLYNRDKEQWVVQCDMIDAEGMMKLLKMDFLGLNNLDILTECIRRIYKNTGLRIDLEHLPMEPEVFKEIFAAGKTGGVFQFESGGMKKMLMEFQPDSFEDIILLVSAYRPGPMDSIPEIIATKHGKLTPTYKIKGLEEILAPTYGKPIYQEQLMDIFHKCAGFTIGEADIIRAYMSKKKKEKFLAYKPKFVQGIIDNGATEEDANELWDSLVSFAEYAFNKSHAAAYAMISYQTAYLKHHFTAEYMCSILNHTSIEKLPAYLYECKLMGLKILAPDINKSLKDFEDRGESIIYGLRPIKGIKSNADTIIEERQNGFYTSFVDFVARTTANSGTIETLIAAGCFDSVEPEHRFSLINHLDEYLKNVSVIKKKEIAIEGFKTRLQDEKDKTAKRQLARNIENATIAIEKARNALGELDMSKYNNDEKHLALEKERELLGAYVTGHPLDSYRSILNSASITAITDFEVGFNTYAGLISDLRIVKRKSDGADMAFFTLEDTSGMIDVCCFANEYRKYKNLVKEGKVVTIGAMGTEDEDYKGEFVQKLLAKDIKECRPRKQPVLLSYANGNVLQTEVLPILSKYRELGGRRVILHDCNTGIINSTKYYVTDEIFKVQFQKACVTPLSL